jgi:protoheme ferro-lyase
MILRQVSFRKVSSIKVEARKQSHSCPKGRDRPIRVIVDAQPARLHSALQKAEEASVNVAIINTPPRFEQAPLAATKDVSLMAIPCRMQFCQIETIPRIFGSPPFVAR